MTNVLHLGDRVRSREPVYLRHLNGNYTHETLEGHIVSLEDHLVRVRVDEWPDWRPHARFAYQDLEVIP